LKDRSDVIVIWGGVGTRAEQAEIARQYFASAYEKYSPDLGEVVLPAYGGGSIWPLSRQNTDIYIRSVLRHLWSGFYPTHMDEAFEQIASEGYTIAGIVLYSGSGQSGNSESSDIIGALERHPGQVVPNLKILFVNTDLQPAARKEYLSAGITAEQVQYDKVTWATEPLSRWVPFGESLSPLSSPPGLLVKLASLSGKKTRAAFAVDHGLTTPEKVRLIEDLLLLERPAETTGDEGQTPVSNDDVATPGAFPSSRCPPICPPPTPPPTPPLGCPPICPPCPPICPPGAGTGGVDLSTLELRYLTEYAQPSDSSYVVGAALSGSRAQPGQGIDLERAAALSSDSFLVWLSLPSSTFWVNLNPSEPDRIIDDRLGRTDVGRIMLEADLQMKKDIGRLTHPDTDLGKAYWDELDALQAPGSGGQQENSISVNFRVWIVPGEVTVFADESQIYVVDAPLDVKLEAEYMEALADGETPGSSEPANASEALGEVEEVLKRMILPKLIEEVNSAPQYRELRQIFYSRVVAEWYKSKARVGDLAVGALVGQSQVESLQSQDSWSPNEIFERYVKSVNEGEYHLTRETREEHEDHVEVRVTTYFHGGVDLMTVPVTLVTFDRLLSEEPKVHEQLLDSLIGHGYEGDTEAWFGGLFVVDIAGFGGKDEPEIRAITDRWMVFVN
jgi:hypothetical protein